MGLATLKNKVAKTLRHLAAPVRPDEVRSALAKVTGGGADILFVHSSLSVCGNFTAGPKDVLAGLRDVAGTLSVPTHSYCYPKAIGEPGPVFDFCSTPSQNGVLTEIFRTQPSVIRSINATHSMAATGPLAEALVEGHEKLDAPCGAGSPYDRLIVRQASVLLFGVSFRSYTPYHTAEDAAGSPFAYEQGTIDRLRYIDRNGEMRERLSRRQSWTPRRFREVGDLLEAAGLVRRESLGRGHLLFVPDCSKVHDFLVERLRRVPDFLYLTCTAPLQ